MKTIYLASHHSEKEWKNKLIDEFKQFKFQDPLKFKFTDTVIGDLSLILTCDTVIVNLSRMSIGAIMEMMFAWQHHKDVYVISEDDSPWLAKYSTKIFKNLGDLIEWMKKK